MLGATRSSELALDVASSRSTSTTQPDAGKVGAWLLRVTSVPDPLLPPDLEACAPNELPPLGAALCCSVQTELRRRSVELFSRWAAEVRAAVAVDAADVRRNDADLVDVPLAPELVEVLVGALGPERDPREVISRGLRYGSGAFAGGMSLHHTLKVIGLLTSVMLDAIDEVLRDARAPLATAAEGIELARLVHRSSALLTLTVVRGYTQSDAESLRERFRHLRHDMRNPLGTIRSVLALMDDESVPIESRANPNFRAIASRNARSLEEMISLELGDAAIPSTPVAEREVSVGALIGTVRRDLRTDAERRGVTIDMERRADIRAPLDGPGLELLLHAVLVAILAESTRGERIVLDLVQETANRVLLRVRRGSGCASIADGYAVEDLVSLAKRMGSVLAVDEDVIITLPLRGTRRSAESVERERRVGAQRGDGSVSGQSSDDVGGPRQGEHGEAGTL
jgi:signal transduction histidine kinase